MEAMECCVPPGFRFHPTEEELVGYYLNRKVNSLKIDLDVITDVDLYRIEPWDIQEKCKFGYEEQKEWYFFSHKDRKYPTGSRTNRATAAGFWKATGRDKAVVSKDKMIGMRKTLVFYKGRAPNGNKTHWIMHEYRLQSSLHAPTQEEGWVVCRAFKKPIPNNNKPLEGGGYGAISWNIHTPGSNYYIGDHKSYSFVIPSSSTTLQGSNSIATFNHNLVSGDNNFPCRFPTESPQHQHPNHDDDGCYDQKINHVLEDSPTTAVTTASHEDHQEDVNKMNNYYYYDNNTNNNSDHTMGMLPSCSFSNMPLLMRDDDDDHISHLFDYFPTNS
ncbi:unnamed protein product [Cuscuta europaea]|uniref:NAC domain-containing protein n=1 Tax=Cuscuta europaea TaxID=41803 RepID=A0A9P0ZSS4_CUSEU|nr:unnamed protein product [Cuscuta europaea]